MLCGKITISYSCTTKCLKHICLLNRSLFLVWSNVLLHMFYMCYHFYRNNTVFYLNPRKYSAYLPPPRHYIYLTAPTLLLERKTWETFKTNRQNMNYSPNGPSINLWVLQRHSSALVVIAVRGEKGGSGGGPGMISGGMKPLWGCTAADGPSTTAEHPVSRLQAAHRESHSVTTITSVSHVHRWLQIGGRPSLAHENLVEPTETGHSPLYFC